MVYSWTRPAVDERAFKPPFARVVDPCLSLGQTLVVSQLLDAM